MGGHARGVRQVVVLRQNAGPSCPAQAVSAGAVLRDVVRGRASDNPWPEVASGLAGIVAIANAWAIATDLDQRILTLATLRPASKVLRIDCSEIWSSWNAEGALSRFAALKRRGSDLGTLANSRAPWNPGTVARSELFVAAEQSAEG